MLNAIKNYKIILNTTTIIRAIDQSTTHYFFQKENAMKESHAIHVASKLLSSYFSFFGDSNSSNYITTNQKTRKNSISTTTKSAVPAILTSPFRFSTQPSKVTISFYYYIAISSNSTKGAFGKKGGKVSPVLSKQQQHQLSRLSSLLSTLFGKQVELSITQLHYPFLQSTILAKYLCHNAVSSTFLHFQEAILSYPSLHITALPSSITGIKIQLSGRILTEPVVPRLTVKSAFVGTFSSYPNGYNKSTGLVSGKDSTKNSNLTLSQNSIDYGSYTTKNQLGAFTIKVWIASQ